MEAGPDDRDTAAGRIFAELLGEMRERATIVNRRSNCYHFEHWRTPGEASLPRLSAGREPAEPATREQETRRVQIVQSAIAQATERGLERVQMQEVARGAHVALGTLYRYFPSKTHLFVGVMAHQVAQLRDNYAKQRPAGNTPSERVFDVLRRANRSLLSKPPLAEAMIQSANSASAATVTDVTVIDTTMRQVLLDAAGFDQPAPQQLAGIGLVLQGGFGAIQSSLKGRLSVRDAEADLGLACQLLLSSVEEPALGPDAVDSSP